MFRPHWVIFREKLSVVVTLGCTIQLSENVPLTVHCAVTAQCTVNGKFLREDDPAGSKHVGVCYNWRKKLFVHSLVFKVFLYNRRVRGRRNVDGPDRRLPDQQTLKPWPAQKRSRRKWSHNTPSSKPVTSKQSRWLSKNNNIKITCCV
jgi:hypothetical protein